MRFSYGAPLRALMCFRRITRRARLTPPHFRNWRIPAASGAAPRRPARDRLPPEIPGNGTTGVRTAGFRGTRRTGGRRWSQLPENRLVPACRKTGAGHTGTAHSAALSARATPACAGLALAASTDPVPSSLPATGDPERRLSVRAFLSPAPVSGLWRSAPGTLRHTPAVPGQVSAGNGKTAAGAADFRGIRRIRAGSRNRPGKKRRHYREVGKSSSAI